MVRVPVLYTVGSRFESGRGYHIGGIMSGIGNRWSGEQEQEDRKRILKDYRPRGTHTLGPYFRQQKEKDDGTKGKKVDSSD